MKVLFAVSNDSISEAIIKRYPKEYKELLSYKNVYFFNAILKEIQKDKSYDRIVISEDLEPFVNTNYDSIDNFIFENLDKISDEAHDNEGKETAIILICSERRSPGSAILNKFFSIGVYNAIMGNDRNMSELCKLINRPRTKKEAKIYYRIDQATYDPVMDNEVNEVEIQNILAHFRKLGKNTERYADSFNNIAAQYTDEQLKIIINVLPMKVKAVLESESNKYQSLMGAKSNGPVSRMDDDDESGISVNTIGKSAPISGPIVIPSGVKKISNRNVNTNIQSPQSEAVKPESVQPRVMRQAEPVQAQSGQSANVVRVQKPVGVDNVQNVSKPKVFSGKTIQRPVVNGATSTIPTSSITNNTGNVNSTNMVNNMNTTNNTATTNNTNTVNTASNINNTNIADNINNVPSQASEVAEIPTAEPQAPVKKGRGRPRKLVVEPPKPKGKRGRPRKVVEQPSTSNLDNLLNDINTENDVPLPGLDENSDLLDVEGNDSIDVPGLGNIDDDTVILPELDEEIDDDVLPGIEDDGEEVDVSSLLEKLDEADDNNLPPVVEDDVEELPGIDDVEELPGIDEDINDDALPGIEDDDVLPGIDESDNDNTEEGTMLPGMGFENTSSNNYQQNIPNMNNVNAVESIKPKVDYSMSNLNSLLSKDKKIVTFLGTTKNGTSFLVNNLALMLSLMGINTAILDMTQNRNSYYIFTDSREELRNIAYTSISKLENGYAEGIKVNKNLSVYTALPADGNMYENAEPILSTLIQNHSLVLIDCDFETDPAYFASCQEIYLVQSMDILTIQPLTAFLRELKFKGAWEPEKVRVVINKETKIRCLNNKMIIAGMSRYNGPDMSVMTDLFNRDMVKACSIPFDEKVYSKYLETMATCKLSLNGYPKPFMTKLQVLGEMVYPRLNSKKSSGSMDNAMNSNMNNSNVFSNNTNDTLNQMKNRY